MKRDGVREMNSMMVDGPETGANTAASPTRLAAAYITCVVVGTVFLGELLQNHERRIQDKPMFITWFIHLDGLFLLIPLAWWHWRSSREDAARRTDPDFRASDAPERVSFVSAISQVFATPSLRWTTLGLTVSMFLADYFWYASLPRISVSASLGIANTLPAWVLILSALLLKEGLSVVKVSSVTLSLIGIVLVACSGSPSEEAAREHGSAVLGYFLAVLSAVFMSVFQVTFKRWWSDVEVLPGEWSHPTKSSIVLLISLAVWNALAMWPLLFFAHVTGLETFASLSAGAVFSAFSMMILDTTVNVLLLLAIHLATPFFVSVGLLMVVPVALLADMLVHKYLLPGVGLTGFVFVVAGFVLVNWLQYYRPPTSERYKWMTREYKIVSYNKCQPIEEDV